MASQQTNMEINLCWQIYGPREVRPKELDWTGQKDSSKQGCAPFRVELNSNSVPKIELEY